MPHLVLVLLALLLTAPPAQAAFPGTNGRIAFTAIDWDSPWPSFSASTLSFEAAGPLARAAVTHLRAADAHELAAQVLSELCLIAVGGRARDRRAARPRSRAGGGGGR